MLEAEVFLAYFGYGARLFSHNVEAAHGLFFSLEGSRLDFFVLEATAQRRERGFTDHDLPGEGARTQPGARVRRVAHDGVGERFGASHVADDPRAGMDPHADGEGRLAFADPLPVEASE